MTIKDATTNSLLMFVAATCVVLIVKAMPQNQSSQQAAGLSNGETGNLANDESPASILRDGVIVYYLHGNTRCVTCRNIEAYAQEAVETGFGDEMKNGKIAWRVVNYDSPGKQHFVTDYDAAAPIVVFVKTEGGKQVRWKRLPEVWEHVGDKAVFIAFVQTSLSEFLGKSPAEPTRAAEPPPSSDEHQELPLPIPE